MDIVHDRWGNEIYITDERWEHIYDRHPEIIGYEEHVLKTLRAGRRKQQPLELNVFKYSASYDDLPENHTQIIVVVKFGQRIDEKGQAEPNNFVITAYMK
ncbi:hypothetical protein H8E77_15500 [bacterium]|nr:hypothetical protein [bacterium]